MAFTACKADDPEVRGQLMVVLQTDMSLPKDVTQVKILVKVGGKPYHDKNYIIAPGEDWITKLPATLAVVASVDDPTPRVEVTVIGLRSREARVFAQAVTTIPEERTATLFVPVQWLCDGQVEELPKDAGYVSSCEPKGGRAQVCRAGSCVDAVVDEDDLKDYDPSDVFGGADEPKNGLCFDTLKCFEPSFRVVPDENCIVEVGVPEGYELNLALLDPANGDGICARAGEPPCYIPLDKNNTFGWKTATGSKPTSVRAQLPVAVCTKLAAKEVAGVQATLACATKTLQFPTCGPWSSVDDSIQLDDPPPAPAPPPPTELIIDFAEPVDVVEIGVSVQLQLTAVDEDGNTTDATEEATWASDDVSVATVERGMVTGRGAGRARITAEVRGEIAEFDIDVERGSPDSIIVAAEDESFPAGRSTQLEATASYGQEVTEEVAEIGVWSSSNPEVATVDASGKVVGVAEGTAEITIELNGTTSEPIVIEVGPAVLESIDVDVQGVSGGDYQLVATGTYSDGSTQDVTEQVTWVQVSGQEFGTVDENGLLTTEAEGLVVVRASIGNITRQANVTVRVDVPDAG